MSGARGASAGPGRPRLNDPRRPGATAREELLDAAAELFTERGYTGTSTRAIAEAVGIRQASMYHHFKTKDDILAELLERTVSPSLAKARELRDGPGEPLARLLELARFDLNVLNSQRWNLGALYLLPEVGAPRFAEFRAGRTALAGIYEELAAAALDDDPRDLRRLLPFRLVESVIMMRADEQRGDLGGFTVVGLGESVIEAIERLLGDGG